MLQRKLYNNIIFFLPKVRSGRRRYRHSSTCWQNKSSLQKMLWSACWGRWLCSSSRTTLKLLNFRLQSGMICQHEYNSFSFPRFPRDEGARKKMNYVLLINLCICNSNNSLLKKNSTVQRGSKVKAKFWLSVWALSCCCRVKCSTL